ncbi:MAG: hypothetical protein NVS4B9_28500 [Ktedonobacteraceae bacterium]
MERISSSAKTTDAWASTPATRATGGPQGIGVAVAFDWAFAVQMIVMPIVRLILASLGFIMQPSIQAAMLIGPLLIAILFATLGEGLRRGRIWARIAQLVISVLGSLAGIGTAVLAILSPAPGKYLLFVPALILLIIPPIMLWRLSRPVTAHWFKTVSSDEARKRHGGAWPWLILLWSIIGGTTVALADSLMMR